MTREPLVWAAAVLVASVTLVAAQFPPTGVGAGAAAQPSFRSSVDVVSLKSR
jgi:hypothetical protein